MEQIKVFSSENDETVKLKNRRVCVHKISDTDGYGLTFVVATDDFSQRTSHRVVRNKAVVTGLKMTKEVALALLIALIEQLKKDGIIE